MEFNVGDFVYFDDNYSLECDSGHIDKIENGLFYVKGRCYGISCVFKTREEAVAYVRKAFEESNALLEKAIVEGIRKRMERN